MTPLSRHRSNGCRVIVPEASICIEIRWRYIWRVWPRCTSVDQLHCPCTLARRGIDAGHGFFIYSRFQGRRHQLHESAAIDLGEHLIRVNCICPGNIRRIWVHTAFARAGMTQADAERMQTRIARCRMSASRSSARVADRTIAQTALFSPAALAANDRPGALGRWRRHSGNARSQIQEISRSTRERAATLDSYGNCPPSGRHSNLSRE